MSSTFLHQEKNISPDEIADIQAPICERCQQQRMWLVKVDTKVGPNGMHSEREYECKICGTAQTVTATRLV